MCVLTTAKIMMGQKLVFNNRFPPATAVTSEPPSPGGNVLREKNWENMCLWKKNHFRNLNFKLWNSFSTSLVKLPIFLSNSIFHIIAKYSFLLERPGPVPYHAFRVVRQCVLFYCELNDFYISKILYSFYILNGPVRRGRGLTTELRGLLLLWSKNLKVCPRLAPESLCLFHSN